MNAAFLEVDSDSVTKRVHQARRKLWASMPAYPEYDLFGINAYPSDVSSAHKKAGCFNLFSGMGHGAADTFEGQSGLPIYDIKDTSGTNFTARGAIVHLYSCDCGRTLGPYLVRLGTQAFIGYSNPVEVSSVSSVEEDFVRVAAAIDRSILSGDSHARTKMKADAEFAAVDSRLSSAGSGVSPRDVARFRLNHRFMVGPWSGSQYGSY